MKSNRGSNDSTVHIVMQTDRAVHCDLVQSPCSSHPKGQHKAKHHHVDITTGGTF